MMNGSIKQFLHFYSKSLKIKFFTLFIFLCFIPKTAAQSFDHSSEGIIYVTENSVVVSYSSNFSGRIVTIAAVKNGYKKEKKPVKIISEKSLSLKAASLKKKSKVITQRKSKLFLKKTESSHEILNGNSLAKNNSVQRSSHTVENEVVFHYTKFNTPVYVHLEKIYKDKNLVLSEFSDSFYSRPPPTVQI